MRTSVTVTAVYHCSLERAFRCPMLCDITKVHTGYGMMPRVTYVAEENNWGKPGGTKRVFMASSFAVKAGSSMIDKVIERKENEYWKIELSDFTFFAWGFKKFTGEWSTKELSRDQILITYTYTTHAGNPLFYPVNWLITHLFWKVYLKKVLENIRKLSCGNEPYQYA
ncbi:MAG: hypothetical protein L6Q81_14530 [Bacteroidia bacterium]|nr:hypothetical protein [Bacteroidia bacterium]